MSAPATTDNEGAKAPFDMAPCPYCGMADKEELGVKASVPPGEQPVFNGACSCGALGPDACDPEEAVQKWNSRAVPRMPQEAPKADTETRFRKVTLEELRSLSEAAHGALHEHNRGTDDIMRSLIGLSDGRVSVPEFVATVGVYANRSRTLYEMLRSICMWEQRAGASQAEQRCGRDRGER